MVSKLIEKRSSEIGRKGLGNRVRKWVPELEGGPTSPALNGFWKLKESYIPERWNGWNAIQSPEIVNNQQHIKIWNDVKTVQKTEYNMKESLVKEPVS
jgi:hypothetical protein